MSAPQQPSPVSILSQHLHHSCCCRQHHHHLLLLLLLLLLLPLQSGGDMCKEQKEQRNFININFLPCPPPKAPFWALEKSLCASFPGKERRKKKGLT